jgi:phospholipid/cholesterol/gamma-HCH transport system substrate-binding protein
MTNRVHRTEARSFLVGILAILVLVAVATVGAIVQVGGPLPAKTYTTVKAEVEDVGILKPGKDVKQAGVRIGTVSAITYVDRKALVTLRLDGDRQVFRDATLLLSNTSVLGRKYVTFLPGTPEAGRLGDGIISAKQTTDAKSVEDVLDTLDAPTRKNLSSALDELGTGLTGHGGDLNTLLDRAPGILDDLETVSAAATSDRADLTGVLVTADRLAGRFKDREDQIAGLLENADTTMGALAVDDGEPLRQTIKALPPTLSETKKALDDLEQPLTAVSRAVTDLRPGGAALGASTEDLRQVLRGAVDPLDKVPGVSKQATPAVKDLTGTLADLRPVIPRLLETLTDAETLLGDLAPYAGDAAQFFGEHTLLSGTLDDNPGKHFFAAEITTLGLFSAGLPDPIEGSEYYPKPGTANDVDK